MPEPRAERARGPPAQPAGAAEHERRGVVDDRAPGRRSRDRRRASRRPTAPRWREAIPPDRALRDARRASPGRRRPGDRRAPPGYALALVTDRSAATEPVAAGRAARGVDARVPCCSATARRRAAAARRPSSPCAADRWYPVLDLAMTEFRVRDVFTVAHPADRAAGAHRRVPRPGQPPRTAQLLPARPDVPPARLVVVGAGGRHRRHPPAGHRHGAVDRPAAGSGWKGVAAVAALLAVVVRGYGQLPLTQPWNPYLPLLAWIVVLLAAWAVLCGDHLMLVPLVVAASFCAQTHVPYLPLGVGMVALGLGTVVWRVVRADPRRAPGPLRSVCVERRRRRRAVAAAGRRPADATTPGNIRQLVDHFGSPPEAAIGVGDGVRIALRHLDAFSGLGRPAHRDRPLRRRRLGRRRRRHARSCGSPPPSWPGASDRGRCARCTSSSPSPCSSAWSRRPASSGGRGTT